MNTSCILIGKQFYTIQNFSGIRRGKGVDEEKLAEEIAKMQRNVHEGNRNEYL